MVVEVEVVSNGKDERVMLVETVGRWSVVMGMTYGEDERMMPMWSLDWGLGLWEWRCVI